MQLGHGAQAHGITLTRLDIQQPMREVLRGQSAPMQANQNIEVAVRQVLSRCCFKGQIVRDNTAEEDATDFLGQLTF